MLTIKLSRTGQRKQPYFKLLLCEKQKDPWGKYLENLGHYNPRSKELVLNADRIKYWLSQGVELTDTVWNLLLDKGLVEGKKRNVTTISNKRNAKLKEKSDKQEAAKAAAQPAPEAKPAEPAPVEKKEEPKKEEVAPAAPEVKPAEPEVKPVEPEAKPAEPVPAEKNEEAQPSEQPKTE